MVNDAFAFLLLFMAELLIKGVSPAPSLLLRPVDKGVVGNSTLLPGVTDPPPTVRNGMGLVIDIGSVQMSPLLICSTTLFFISTTS